MNGGNFTIPNIRHISEINHCIHPGAKSPGRASLTHSPNQLHSSNKCLSDIDPKIIKAIERYRCKTCYKIKIDGEQPQNSGIMPLPIAEEKSHNKAEDITNEPIKDNNDITENKENKPDSAIIAAAALPVKPEQQSNTVYNNEKSVIEAQEKEESVIQQPLKNTETTSRRNIVRQNTFTKPNTLNRQRSSNRMIKNQVRAQSSTQESNAQNSRPVTPVAVAPVIMPKSVQPARKSTPESVRQPAPAQPKVRHSSMQSERHPPKRQSARQPVRRSSVHSERQQPAARKSALTQPVSSSVQSERQPVRQPAPVQPVKKQPVRQPVRQQVRQSARKSTPVQSERQSVRKSTTTQSVRQSARKSAPVQSERQPVRKSAPVQSTRNKKNVPTSAKTPVTGIKYRVTNTSPNGNKNFTLTIPHNLMNKNNYEEENRKFKGSYLNNDTMASFTGRNLRRLKVDNILKDKIGPDTKGLTVQFHKLFSVLTNKSYIA